MLFTNKDQIICYLQQLAKEGYTLKTPLMTNKHDSL